MVSRGSVSAMCSPARPPVRITTAGSWWPAPIGTSCVSESPWYVAVSSAASASSSVPHLAQ